MNKYQKFLLNYCRAYVKTDYNFDKNVPVLDLIDDNKYLIINQDDNYNIKTRNLMLVSDSILYIEVDNVKYLRGNKPELRINSSYIYIIVPFDFDKKANEITFHFVDDLADPLTLNLKYVEADHSIYDSKVQAKLNEQIKPEHKTGADLVNLYWNYVAESTNVKINLYSISNEGERLIAKYNEREVMFKSIMGLAYGKYCYEIIEYDDNGNTIALTQHMPFEIKKPINGNGKPTIII